MPGTAPNGRAISLQMIGKWIYSRLRGTSEDQDRIVRPCNSASDSDLSEKQEVKRQQAMAAYQVRIAYMTPLRRSRHYFHQLVLASDRQGALTEGRALLKRRSPEARIIHETASMRPDSRDAEAAIRAGWRLKAGWWTRPTRASDDLATIAMHGHVAGKRISTRTAAGCVAIDRVADMAAQA